MLDPTVFSKKSRIFSLKTRRLKNFANLGNPEVNKKAKVLVPSYPKISLKIEIILSFSLFKVFASIPKATKLMMSTVKRFAMFLTSIGCPFFDDFSMAAMRFCPLVRITLHIDFILPEENAGVSLERRKRQRSSLMANKWPEMFFDQNN
jgi:hypothetical protein